MADAGWRSLVARLAHNQKVTGSNPVPATEDPWDVLARIRRQIESGEISLQDAVDLQSDFVRRAYEKALQEEAPLVRDVQAAQDGEGHPVEGQGPGEAEARREGDA